MKESKNYDITPTEYVYLSYNSLVAPHIPLLKTEVPSLGYRYDGKSLSPEKAEEIVYEVLESIGETDLYYILYKLGNCESGFDETKCGDHGVSCGWFQFKKDTFYHFCPELKWENSEHQVICAVRLIKLGLGHQPSGWYNCWRIENLPIL